PLYRWPARFWDFRSNKKTGQAKARRDQTRRAKPHQAGSLKTAQISFSEFSRACNSKIGIDLSFRAPITPPTRNDESPNCLQLSQTAGLRNFVAAASGMESPVRFRLSL